MQDRYVGDVGDFGKYGLLRAIGHDLSLGVVWYLTPDESHNADGKHTTFLTRTPKNLSLYRACDPELYDALGKIVRGGQRTVAVVRQNGVLPTGTTFFEDPLSYAQIPNSGPASREARLSLRRSWLDRALSHTTDADVVFLDPDNGFAFGTKSHEAKGPKYVYFAEVQPFLDRGQSVVAYHHLNRIATADVQVEAMLKRLRTELTGCGSIHALRFRKGSPRVFFVIPVAAHEALVSNRITHFMHGAWSKHFSYAGESPAVHGVFHQLPSGNVATFDAVDHPPRIDCSTTFIARVCKSLGDVLTGFVRSH